MRLTQFTDFSLRTLMFLAMKDDELSTVSEISQAYDISRNHLVKVTHNLSKEGLIESFKGKGGGIRLAKDPSEINIGKVVAKLEADTILVECMGDLGNCKIDPACKLKNVLGKAKKSFYAVLEAYTLKDMVKNKNQLSLMLDI